MAKITKNIDFIIIFLISLMSILSDVDTFFEFYMFILLQLFLIGIASFWIVIQFFLKNKSFKVLRILIYPTIWIFGNIIWVQIFIGAQKIHSGFAIRNILQQESILKTNYEVVNRCNLICYNYVIHPKSITIFYAQSKRYAYKKTFKF